MAVVLWVIVKHVAVWALLKNVAVELFGFGLVWILNYFLIFVYKLVGRLLMTRDDGKEGYVPVDTNR